MDTLPNNLDLQLGTSAAYAAYADAKAAYADATAAYANATAAYIKATAACTDATAAYADAKAASMLALLEAVALGEVGRICPIASLTFVDARTFHQRWFRWLGKLR